MKVNRVSGYIGAEITGIDLRQYDQIGAFSRIRELLNEYGVLFFYDQNLTVDEYIRFGRQFGDLFINNSPSISALPDHPEVEILRKASGDVNNIGDDWHSDQAHRNDPCMGTILYGLDIPPYGGDTLFANTAAAYENLSKDVQEEINDLRAVHSLSFLIRRAIERKGDPEGRLARAAKAAQATAIHRVVQLHPDTGRRCIYVNPAYTERFEGKTREESIPLLNLLYNHILLPEFGCRFRWKSRAVAFWDNRQVWHYATNDYQGYRRELYRLVVRAIHK